MKTLNSTMNPFSSIGNGTRAGRLTKCYIQSQFPKLKIPAFLVCAGFTSAQGMMEDELSVEEKHKPDAQLTTDIE